MAATLGSAALDDFRFYMAIAYANTLLSGTDENKEDDLARRRRLEAFSTSASTPASTSTATDRRKENNLQSCLLRLPQEILTHIIFHVSFSKHGLQTLGQVCRHFRDVISSRTGQASSMLGYLASLRFPIVEWVMGPPGGRVWYDLEVFDEMREMHESAMFLLGVVRDNTHASDLEADGKDWEQDFFYALMIWEKVSRLNGSRPLWQPHRINDLNKVLTVDACLALRYICVRVTRSIHQIAQGKGAKPKKRLLGPPEPADYFDDAISVDSASKFTTGLELAIPHSKGISSLAQIFKTALAMPFESDASRRKHKLFQVSLWYVKHFEPYKFRANSSRGWQGGEPSSDWLCDPRGIRDPVALAQVRQLQAQITRMVQRTSSREDVDPLNFICGYVPVNSTTCRLGSPEHECGPCCERSQMPMDKDMKRNMFLRKKIREFVEKALQDQEAPRETETLTYCIQNYNWECVLDTELTQGNSGLRRSMPPMKEIMMKVAGACACFERSDEVWGEYGGIKYIARHGQIFCREA